MLDLGIFPHQKTELIVWEAFEPRIFNNCFQKFVVRFFDQFSFLKTFSFDAVSSVMEILKIIDRSKGMSAILVPTIETEDKLWIRVSFSFFSRKISYHE